MKEVRIWKNKRGGEGLKRIRKEGIREMGREGKRWRKGELRKEEEKELGR